MKKRLLAAALVICGIGSQAQQCGNCKQTPSVANYDLDVQVPKPDVNNLKDNQWLEWLQLFWLSKHANATLFKNNKNCIRFTQPGDASLSSESFTTKDGIEVPPLVEESQQIKVGETYTNLPPSGDLSRFGNYIITGSVSKSGSGYVMHMEVQSACSRKTVAAANVPFQISAYSANTISIANQAASQLSPLIDKIKQFELKERKENPKAALEGIIDDAITIKPKKRNLAAGEQTEIEITMKDCDGEPLANRQIIFTKASLNGIPISAGTTGGTVTPSTVTTDAGGKAKASFKMGTGKSAIIDAHHIYQKPYGCEDVKLGSTPIGSIPIKVSVSYFQNESQTLKRATLPGVDLEGGNEIEETNMSHTSILYHYPSAADLKKGYLIIVEKDKPSPDSKTEHFMEVGHFNYTKKVEDAKIFVIMGDKRVQADVEKGSMSTYNGTASLKHPSQMFFYKGDANTPPQFWWSAEYPASNGEDIASGGARLEKGAEGVKWTVKKITDPNSPYKTEYLLDLNLDAAEELKKGFKGMKDVFGFDLDGLTKAIDPTKPKDNMAGASGSQTIMVRILSPYPDE